MGLQTSPEDEFVPEGERRWRDIDAALGTIEDGAHEWDSDPQSWVCTQREADPHRVG